MREISPSGVADVTVLTLGLTVAAVSEIGYLDQLGIYYVKCKGTTRKRFFINQL